MRQFKDISRGSLRKVVIAVAVLVIAIPAAAWAAHFTDVPNSNIFHADIQWMADNGVTKGCNPPANTKYCPKDNVTREQMAAFMHRLETEGVFAPGDHEHVALFGTATGAAPTSHSNTSFANLSGASTTVTIPEGHNGVLIARFSAQSACYGANGSCLVRLRVNGTEMSPGTNIFHPPLFDSSDNNTESSASAEAHAIERISGTLPAGTHTVTVQVRTNSNAVNLRLDDWALVAEAKLTS